MEQAARSKPVYLEKGRPLNVDLFIYPLSLLCFVSDVLRTGVRSVSIASWSCIFIRDLMSAPYLENIALHAGADQQSSIAVSLLVALRCAGLRSCTALFKNASCSTAMPGALVPGGECLFLPRACFHCRGRLFGRLLGRILLPGPALLSLWRRRRRLVTMKVAQLLYGRGILPL